jgi:plastocyanin
VRLRRQMTLGVVALLGAAVAVMPAIAGSETAPTIEAVNVPGFYGEGHHWSPAEVTIGAGGAVTVSNPTEVNHGVYWISGPATPSCTGGVPVGSSATASGTKWSGTCTFASAGVYTFYCTVHGSSMTGRVTVTAAKTTTTTTQPGGETTPAPGGAGTTTVPATGSETGSTATPGASTTPGSPLLGPPAKALELSSRQHGASIRGSVAIAPAGAGGRLQVDLFVRGAALASAGHLHLVRVGRTVRPVLATGTVHFAVALDASARTALRRHGSLTLSVRLRLTPLVGATVTVVRGVRLHR